MARITRKTFINHVGLLSTSYMLFNGCDIWTSRRAAEKVILKDNPLVGEDVFSYIQRVRKKMDMTLYRQILGAANAFKEGDQTLNLVAGSEAERTNARMLIANTKLKDLDKNTVYRDDLLELILKTTLQNPKLQSWTLGDLKQFVLSGTEDSVRTIMPALTSDVIACLVKLMSNEELILVGQKIFNPLPNSKIGSKGYMSARVQPNSPTDHIDDITWQVFDAWSYAVGDLLLGTNPVSSDPKSVARIEKALFDILTTFELQEVMPNCVLSHIDIQALVEEIQPGTTGIWFQSLAGTVKANQTFDVTIEKMFDHASRRNGRYGLYAETGQGADFTNGHGEGFDMVIHESRKYGFLRALKKEMTASKTPGEMPWVFVNDVAGFIGPEVFASKEQLVRCCLEDTVMGKLHGLTIGLDICSTLHMDVSLDDLDWCIEQIMPANPAYLMALPTKNDPMLSYLTTAFSDHVKIREQFGYKVNDVMWDFFKKLKILDINGRPTEHFGDPTWVYYQYCMAKKDPRSRAEIYEEGQKKLSEIRQRGVPIAEGYGENTWDPDPDLDREVHRLYEDAKVSIWTEKNAELIATVPTAVPIVTKSKDRKDYVYHPESGERLNAPSARVLENMKQEWGTHIPDIQIIISDGLNVRALLDEGHLTPYLTRLKDALQQNNYHVSANNIVIRYGRVRAGYACGEFLFSYQGNSNQRKSIIHIIGERPGSGHHNFSAYITVAPTDTWNQKGVVDHDISRVVSGISDTSLLPERAVTDTLHILEQLYTIV